MPAESIPGRFETQWTLRIALACIAIEVTNVVGTLVILALAHDDVRGFCGTVVASATSLLYVLARTTVMLGSFCALTLATNGLVRTRASKALVPGLIATAVVVTYVLLIWRHVLPAPPRPPCLR